MIIFTSTIPGKAATFAIGLTPGRKPPIHGEQFNLIV